MLAGWYCNYIKIGPKWNQNHIRDRHGLDLEMKQNVTQFESESRQNGTRIDMEWNGNTSVLKLGLEPIGL